MSDDKIIRKRILIRGVVQGVGFRPYVYRLAVSRGLSGWVNNNTAGVTAEAEGPARAVQGFLSDIAKTAPAASRIDSVAVSDIPAEGGNSFTIRPSSTAASASAVIPPDLALCADCRRELENPEDRRYLYPFINCTNCGPRFTIVRAIPYDRPQTTMHVLGWAADIRIRGYSPAKIRNFVAAKRVGGVGYYPYSGFVHMDVGRVRYWNQRRPYRRGRIRRKSALRSRAPSRKSKTSARKSSSSKTSVRKASTSKSSVRRTSSKKHVKKAAVKKKTSGKRKR